MKDTPLRIGAVIEDEWRQIFRNRTLFSILFLVPLIYTAFFGYLYSQHQITEIKTVVFDGDGSQLSRQIIQAFDESATFQVIKQVRNEPEVEQAIETGKAKVGVIIPNDFSDRLKRGEYIPVMTLIDGSNMMFSNAAVKAANEIVTTFSYAVTGEKLGQNGLNDEQVQSMITSIPFRSRILYNPAFSYSHFMVYGLMGAMLQQVLLLGLAITVTREKESGTWTRFQEWSRCPWKIAYTKTAPYILIGLFNHFASFSLALYVFHLPFRGDVLSAILLMISFVFALAGIGYAASQFSPNQVQAIQFTMIIAVPSFMLSGFTWPFDAMPKLLYWLGHCLPLTYFVDGIREILIKGHGWEMVWRNCVILVTMGLGSFLAAFLMTPVTFKITKHKEKEPGFILFQEQKPQSF